MKTYQYINKENTVVAVFDDDGVSRESRLASTLPDGTNVLPYVDVTPIVNVSPRQIRQALTRAGLRSQVESAISAGDQDTKDWYEFATEFDRSNPRVVAMGVALGVSTQQLDDLWKLAATL